MSTNDTTKVRILSMAEDRDDGLYSGSHTFSFTEKTWYEHVWEYCKKMPAEIGVFAALVISTGAIAEVISRASGEYVSIEELAGPILLFSSTVLLYRMYRSKRDYVPNALVGESEAVKYIFVKQKCGWNAALAKRMLEDRIRNVDASMERINRGAEFIEPRKVDRSCYIDWLQSRPESLTRMIRSVALMCTQEVPIVV